MLRIDNDWSENIDRPQSSCCKNCVLYKSTLSDNISLHLLSDYFNYFYTISKAFVIARLWFFHAEKSINNHNCEVCIHKPNSCKNQIQMLLFLIHGNLVMVCRLSNFRLFFYMVLAIQGKLSICPRSFTTFMVTHSCWHNKHFQCIIISSRLMLKMKWSNGSHSAIWIF